jgi:hypothetical protein
MQIACRQWVIFMLIKPLLIIWSTFQGFGLQICSLPRGCKGQDVLVGLILVSRRCSLGVLVEAFVQSQCSLSR